MRRACALRISARAAGARQRIDSRLGFNVVCRAWPTACRTRCRCRRRARCPTCSIVDACPRAGRRPLGPGGRAAARGPGFAMVRIPRLQKTLWVWGPLRRCWREALSLSLLPRKSQLTLTPVWPGPMVHRFCWRQSRARARAHARAPYGHDAVRGRGPRPGQSADRDTGCLRVRLGLRVGLMIIHDHHLHAGAWPWHARARARAKQNYRARDLNELAS